MKDYLNELLTMKKNLLQRCCITENKILVMVPVQRVFLFPLRDKLQALEYKCR